MNEEDLAPPKGGAATTRARPAPTPSHEELQRLGPVRRCLEEALASAEDDRLAEAEIVEIVPRSGGQRMTVVIAGAPQHVLDRAARWLHGELTAAMNRRRVPTLDLIALPTGASRGEP
jgi:hypothetical protein